MRKFILSIAMLISVVLLSVNFLYRLRTSSLLRKFQSISSSYDVISLGTSHGGGIYFDGINGKAFNRAGNTLFYDLQNYKYLKPHLIKNAIVIIPVSYYAFGLDENRTDYQDPTAFVNDLYMYLPSESIYGFTYKKKIKAYFNVARVNYSSVINERFELSNIKSKSNDISKKTKQDKLEYHAKGRVLKHKELGQYSSAEKNIDYLNELITEISKSGHHPVLITTPYFRAYNVNFGNEWIEKNYYNYINEIKNTFNISYFDYSKDDRFENEVEFFSNSDHLSEKGAKYFSQILFKDLEKLNFTVYEYIQN